MSKFDYDKKLSGIYEHTVLDTNNELVRGFDKHFFAPHSRYTGIKSEEIRKVKELSIIAESEETGAYIISDGGKNIFVNGHPEYDLYRLAEEYIRDTDKGISPEVPANYFPDNDPDKEPVVKRYDVMYDPEDVVKLAWRDVKAGRDMSRYGAVARFQGFLSKLLPHSFVMSYWMRQQKLN